MLSLALAHVTGTPHDHGFLFIFIVAILIVAIGPLVLRKIIVERDRA